MQFITSIFIVSLSAYCSALCVGFTTSFRSESAFIIGEISKDISSVVVADILQQLRAFKNSFAVSKKKSIIFVNVGKRIKVSRRVNDSESPCLYDSQCDEFMEFLKSEITSSANSFIRNSFTLFQKPSLFISTSEEIPDKIQISLDELNLFDIKELFSESMEVSSSSISDPPPLEYEDIFESGYSSTSALLRRKKPKAKKCFDNCCCALC